MNEKRKDNQADETGEGGGLVELIKNALRGEVVEWDIGQRHQALRAATVECYVGLLLVMVQVIAHRGYKALRGVDPVFMDKFVRVWLVSGYYVTLVWTVVVYLAMLRFSFLISGPGANNARRWWWRLDTRSLHLLLLVAPLCCLVVAGQLTVSLAYPFVYKNILYNNFMHGIDEYYTSAQVRRFIDVTQEAYKCCGFHSYQDWIKLRRIRGRGEFPFSCCQKGFLCDKDNIVNYLASYKTWYETEDYSIKNAKVPFKEKIKSMSKVLYDVPDDELPFTDKGCAGRLLDARPFYWPLVFDMIQIVVITRALVNIRRYSTGTAFANRAVQACPRDYTMLNAAHACPRWTLLRPSKTALWRWQQDYLVQMYFYLVYTGQMKPDEHHEALYPDMPITVPNFEESFDLKVRAYKSFLRRKIGRQRTKGRKRARNFLFG